MRLRIAPLAAAALLGLTLGVTEAAGTGKASSATGSYIYWVNSGNTIGRASADGSNVNSNLISVSNNTDSVAVDSQYVYWTNEGSQIGRATLDGSNPNQSFISGADFGNSSHPVGLAVDGQHVYWSNVDSIARANLDGTNVDETFINGVVSNSVTVDDQYVYWDAGCAIGRANLDGSNVNATFISFPSTEGCRISGVAVDSQHIYWSEPQSAELGRANLDGSNVNQDFIDSPNQGLAIDGQHIYWMAWNTYSIGRANLDGSNVNRSFVTGVGGSAYGIAVSPVIAAATPPPTTTAATTTATTTPTTTATTPPPTPKPKPAVTVITAIKGNGRVSGGSIRCPSKCSAMLMKSGVLAIRAYPSRGYRFAGWSGACPIKAYGLGTCTLAVYLDSLGDPATRAKIAGKGWSTFTVPSSAETVRVTATFKRA